jgi:hypothetical protein
MTARMRRWALGQFRDVDAAVVLHQLATLPDQLRGAGSSGCRPPW